MGKINNEIIYVQDTDISDLDYVIGTNGNTNAKITKNFLLGSLKNYLKAGLSPLTGGTLQLTEITYTGGLYSTFAQVINALDPNVTIGQYHVVVVTLNGAKAIFKLQDRVVGLGQTAVLVGDFIILSTAQVNADWSSTTGVSQVLNKPTIPASQVNADWNSTSGVSQVLNKPTIPASQVNSDWNSTSGVSQILNKPTVDGSETKVNSGTNVTVTGAGTAANPYVISSPDSNNLQKIISANYTLTNADNNYVILINNSTTAIAITVPAGLTANLNVGFIQQGSGVVSFVASGTTINTAVGLKIKAQNYNAYLEKVGATEVYQLLGNLIA